MKRYLGFYLILGFLAGSGGFAMASESHSCPIPEWTQVDKNLYRGGQPKDEDYACLKKLGIHTIVNFRHEEDQIEYGREKAREQEIRYVSIPWTIYGAAGREEVTAFFEIFEKPENLPVFIHCRRGVERTGVMAALYHMKFEGLSEEEAYDKGFNGFPVKWIWRPFTQAKFKGLKEAAELSQSS